MTRQIIRKISISGAKVGTIAAAPGQRQFMGRVAGFANGIKVNVTQYGESYGLVGAFRIINPDGTTEDAPVLYGPSVLLEPIHAAIKAGQSAVTVGPVDVYAVLSDRAAVGFTYVLESHTTADVDPLTKALEGLPAVPRIEAPKKAQKS